VEISDNHSIDKNMETKKILSWIALLGGEAIIIAAFILFRGSLANDILALNIVVSFIIYGLLFIDIIAPWIDLDNKSQAKVGSLGVRWFFTWLYAIAAVAAMLAYNLAFDCSFALQIITHGALIFFLALGFLASLHSSDKVQQAYQQETLNRNGVIEMKRAVQKLKDKINDVAGVPESFAGRVNALEENMRFISPAENAEVHSLERQFVSTINDISVAVSDFSMNEERIEINLKKVEKIYQRRKSAYSN
jgi:membrane protein implicated in regulation of membrane protease activity